MERVLEAVGYQEKCTGTNNLALGIAKEITGEADNSDKPRGGTWV